MATLFKNDKIWKQAESPLTDTHTHTHTHTYTHTHTNICITCVYAKTHMLYIYNRILAIQKN